MPFILGAGVKAVGHLRRCIRNEPGSYVSVPAVWTACESVVYI